MAEILTTTPHGETLLHWLRLLFNRTPQLHFDSDVPYIAAGTIHLPRRAHWSHDAAAAAHAAAHLVYSPPTFDGSRLGPIARALVGLLEDARVEALAMRELPGLARLWRPLHVATPALGTGLEALLQRLARALVDPDYDDPEAWVRKGKALFFLDEWLGVPALRTPSEVRTAALRLGHDLGQMRLQLNATGYRPAPAYRDDHRWMWTADMPEAASSTASHGEGEGEVEADVPSAQPDATVSLYPEWDRLIERLRPDWARVVERRSLANTTHRIDDGPSGLASAQGMALLASRVREPLRVLARDASAGRRTDDGDDFDVASLVDWRIARLLRTTGDTRVHRGVDRRGRRSAVWLLVDCSASTAAPLDRDGPSVLQAASRVAAATAIALQSLGVDCAIAAFHSSGRHAVDIDVVKDFGVRADAAVIGRLQALRSAGSTRLGAALRHAASRLAGRSATARWVIVLSDGEPHDIDAHDPHYLVEDARQAVRGARRRSFRVACIALEAERGAAAVRIFGRHGVCSMQAPRQLAGVVRRLLG